MKEAEIWEGIEKEKAKQRQAIAGSKNLGLIKDNVPELDKNQTRDILAEKVNLGSGRTYERAKPAVKKIDELKEEGNEKDAEFLKIVLNESVRGAESLTKLESLNEISEEIKNKVINKEIPVQKAVKIIRQDLSIITDDMKKDKGNKNNNEMEMKICSKCGQKKSILEFYTGRAECRDCHKKPSEKNSYEFEGVDLLALEADIKNPNKI